MTLTTKDDFLNIKIDDKKIRDYLDLITEKENIEEASINFVYGVLDSVLNPKKYLIEITKDYKETNSCLVL